MQENPVISDWVPSSGGSTEGLLGGRLAQRQAALRGMLAAGALSTFTLGRLCVPVLPRAPSVPQILFGIKSALRIGLNHEEDSEEKNNGLPQTRRPEGSEISQELILSQNR
jgi:hypothetical protein